ncbi:transposase, partial [Candidatus Mycoplasma pogonae]
QGWQYQMKKYQNALEEKGIIQSMSRKGNCLDNSIMENFFGILKREMFYGHEHEFEDIEDLIKAIENYIEYYNNQRISIRLNKMTPAEFRDHSNT